LQAQLRGEERVRAFAAFHILSRAGLGVGAIGAGIAGDFLGRVEWPIVGLLEPARLVLVCSGLPGPSAYTPEQQAAVETAIEAGELERSVELELEIWAPLGFDNELGRIALENAHVNGDVDAEPVPLEPPAAERMGEMQAPTLVITGDRDVARMEEIGDQLEREIPGALRVRFADSDHFPNWREPDRFNEVVLEFLASA